MTTNNVQHQPAAASDSIRGGGDLRSMVEGVVETMGYELVHLDWSQSGRHRRLRVYLDHPDGVGLDDCARLSPVISNALDAAEADPETGVGTALAGAYVLEVSSPGLDRPLAKRAHFERFVGHKAKIKTRSPLSVDDVSTNQRSFAGTIESVTPPPVPATAGADDPFRGVVHLRDPDHDRVHRIPIELIQRANLVYEG